MKEFLKKIVRAIVKGAIYIYCKIVFRLKVVGKENIPKEGPLILCANHRGYIDGPVMMVSIGRYTRFLAKVELSKNPFLNFLAKFFDIIFVTRDNKDIVVIKESLKTLKNGQCLALFPEGMRNGLAKGAEVKDGAAFFAARTGAKVLPCGIKGGKKGNWQITVTYGKPLDFSQYKGAKDKETLDLITKEIMDSIISLTK